MLKDGVIDIYFSHAIPTSMFTFTSEFTFTRYQNNIMAKIKFFFVEKLKYRLLFKKAAQYEFSGSLLEYV